MFAQWLFGIVGIAALGILIDILLPQGETAKYIKGVFSLVTVLVVVSPVPALLKIDLSPQIIFEASEETFAVDDDFVRFFYRTRYDDVENSLTEYIYDEYGLNSDADVFFVENCPEIIDIIYIYLKNNGIAENVENKYIIEDIVEFVANNLNLHTEQVNVQWVKTNLS